MVSIKRQTTDNLLDYNKNLAPLARLERAAHGLGIRCSIHLSYRGVGLNIGFMESFVKMEAKTT